MNGDPLAMLGSINVVYNILCRPMSLANEGKLKAHITRTAAILMADSLYVAWLSINLACNVTLTKIPKF